MITPTFAGGFLTDIPAPCSLSLLGSLFSPVFWFECLRWETLWGCGIHLFLSSVTLEKVRGGGCSHPPPFTYVSALAPAWWGSGGVRTGGWLSFCYSVALGKGGYPWTLGAEPVGWLWHVPFAWPPCLSIRCTKEEGSQPLDFTWCLPWCKILGT